MEAHSHSTNLDDSGTTQDEMTNARLTAPYIPPRRAGQAPSGPKCALTASARRLSAYDLTTRQCTGMIRLNWKCRLSGSSGGQTAHMPRIHGPPNDACLSLEMRQKFRLRIVDHQHPHLPRLIGVRHQDGDRSRWRRRTRRTRPISGSHGERSRIVLGRT